MKKNKSPKFKVEICGIDKNGNLIRYPEGHHPKFSLSKEIINAFAQVVYHEMLQQKK